MRHRERYPNETSGCYPNETSPRYPNETSEATDRVSPGYRFIDISIPGGRYAPGLAVTLSAAPVADAIDDAIVSGEAAKAPSNSNLVKALTGDAGIASSRRSVIVSATCWLRRVPSCA